ncbi:hypothetical protein JCM14469_06850 [Desulfatiferula olefinivorans]
MRSISIVVVLVLGLGLAACVTGQKSSTPNWVYNSAVEGKVTGIGVCGEHVNGVNAQRSLAIKRAIDEMALQMGVKVSNVALIGTKAGAAGSSSSVESYSFQTVDGNVVKAVIRETWKNPKTNEIYIWMVTE